MDENKLMEYARDLKTDIGYALLEDSEIVVYEKDEKAVIWLIEQAEQLKKIKKLSNADELTVKDFGLEVLRIVDGREIPKRKPMT